MFKDQNLYFNDMIEKINKAKEDLEKNNETLQRAKGKIVRFINDNTFQGNAAETTKMQMETYTTVVDAMMLANDLDIEDYGTLVIKLNDAHTSVGFDDLIGEIIVEQMAKAKSMVHQDLDRAQEYDRKQTSTYDPIADAWYEYKKRSYKKSAEENEKLYDKWKEKSEKYNEVERNTSNLFEKSRQLRLNAQNALRELGKNFNGSSFDVYDDDGWKTELYKAIAQGSYIGLGSYGLNMESEELLYNSSTGEWEKMVPFGGDQAWFDNESIEKFLDSFDWSKMTPEEAKLYYELKLLSYDPKLNDALTQGCPVIALINTFYMMEGKTHVSRLEFMVRVYKFLDEHPEYKERCLKKKNAGLPNEDDDDKASAEKYLDEYVKKNGYASGVEFKYIDEDKDSLDYIKEQVKKKRPIIIGVNGIGDEYPKGVNLYEDNKGTLKRYRNIEYHDMTITGVTRQVNPQTGQLEDFCEVSSWGKKFYIPYSDIKSYRNNIQIGEYK